MGHLSAYQALLSHSFKLEGRLDAFVENDLLEPWIANELVSLIRADRKAVEDLIEEELTREFA